MSSPLIRSALMVRDLERSSRFYREALGLTATYLEADLTGSVAWRQLGFRRDATVRALIIKPPAIAGQPAPDFGMIGLFELGDDAVSAVTPRADGVSFGETVLVFYVENLAQSLAKVCALGGQIITGPDRFEYRDISVAEAIVRDPDGIAVNLVETDERLAWGPNLPA